MNKTISYILIVLLLMPLLFGCSHKNDLTEAVYESGCIVVDITDRFLRGEIGASEAARYISLQVEKMSDNAASVGDKRASYDSITKSRALIISSNLLSYAAYSATRNEIIENRNELAKFIGIKLYVD